MTTQERADEITYLQNLIADGDKFEKQGYACGMLNTINRKLLVKLLKEQEGKK